MRVLMIPHLTHFRSAESGIKRVVEAYFKYLPDYGIELVEPDQSYDVKAVHAGTAPDGDVAHLHGLYWSADYQPAKWEWAANASVVDSIRNAKLITVPSEWVAETIRRDIRVNPAVIGHGIDWKDWLHSEPNEGYVLWNKNRTGDVCNPEPVRHLAAAYPGVNFVSTFYTGEASNVRWTGIVDHPEMKRLVQRCGVYLATTKETFGIGILEAMAAGKPVLGFRQGGILEMVQHGVNGYLATNYEDLTAGLAYCIEHHKTLGANGREMVKAFTWQTACEKVAAVYRQALEPEAVRVTVVIPSYNYADKVKTAIESVRAQTFTDWELFIVDDGSTDDSETAIPALVGEMHDNRIHYTRQANQGVAHARNNGASLGTAKYICCLDADDAIAPLFLERCVTALEKDRGLGIAYTSLQWTKPDGSTGVSPWPPNEWSFDAQLARHNQVPTCCVYRREMWRRLGGYRSRYCPLGQGSEDAEFWTRCGAYGWKAAKITEEPLFLYSWLSGRTAKAGYNEPDWLAWHPWARDKGHPFASYATPAFYSHPVRAYDAPTISVVIPVGPGHERMLIDALDSLEAQTFRRWEAIVINDTGNALDLTAYPYVRLLETEGRRGPGYCRNRGTEMARAPLLMYLDADDYLQPAWMEQALGAYDGRWVYCDCYILHPDGSTESYVVPDWSIDQLHHSGVAGVTCLYSKEMWAEVGGFEEQHNREDWDFHLRLASAGYCGVRLPVFGFTYRHATGQRRDGDIKADVERIRGIFQKEQLYMACAGCSKKRAALAQAPIPAGAQTKDDLGWPLLEYTGKNRADVVYNGATGRKYRFGNNDQSRRVWVHPDDKAHLLRYRIFREIVLPQVEPQVVIQSEALPRITEPPKPVAANVMTDSSKRARRPR